MKTKKFSLFTKKKVYGSSLNQNIKVEVFFFYSDETGNKLDIEEKKEKEGGSEKYDY